MLGKILTLVAILAVVYLIFFKTRKIDKPKDEKEIENFIECEKCGTFVPLKSTILSGGKHFCRDCLKG